jgi:hypothetical protein
MILRHKFNGQWRLAPYILGIIRFRKWVRRRSELIQISSSFTNPVRRIRSYHLLSMSPQHPHQLMPRLKGVQQYLYSPSGPLWPVLGYTLSLPFTFTSMSPIRHRYDYYLHYLIYFGCTRIYNLKNL